MRIFPIIAAAFCAASVLVNGPDLAASARPMRTDPAPSASLAADWRPASYDAFVDARRYRDVEQTIASNRYVYLKPGVYVLDNPVVINRSQPLFITGAGRMQTILKPRNPARPLFIVERAPLINFAGIHFRGAPVPGFQMILFKNTTPVRFEMQDCFLGQGMLDMKGPGSYRLQGTFVANRGMNLSPLVVDNPLADFLVVGGNMVSGGSRKPAVTGRLIFDVWQKQGRVRIYGTGIQHSAGVADFRIDTASTLGPDVIAYVRSEGANGPHASRLPSALLYVPPSSQKVNVLLTANAGMWPRDRRAINTFVNYNAAGTVWLIGNSSPYSVDHMVLGNAPAATIVALGNRIFSGSHDPFPTVARTRFDIGNTYSYEASTGDDTPPNVRFLHDPGTLTSINSMPPVPRVPLPQPLPRPVMNRALPGMLDVKRDFGAQGNGIADDTAALQKALVSGKDIYLPAGTYRITRTLGFDDRRHGRKALGPGGWIAGAGKDKTIILRDPTQKGSVFATDGMAYITIQGISFETADYRAGAAHPITTSAVSLEFDPRFRGAFATQEVMFYDCRFRGGRYAASIGLRTRTMGSENMFIDSEFEHAKYGLAIGSYNALNNIAYGSTFKDNDITIGQDRTRNTGGSGALLDVNVIGTKDREIALYNTSGEPWYFNGVRSHTRRLFTAGSSSIPFLMVFDQCDFDPQPPVRVFAKSQAGGGFYFLNSTISSGFLELSSRMSALPVFSLQSHFPGLSRTVTGRHVRIYLRH